MQKLSKFNQLSTTPDFTTTLQNAINNMASDLNCVKIGIIQEFYPENLTAQVLLSNKKLIGLNPNGTQNIKDYPPIYSKVCYCCPFVTYPIKKGDECVLLFSDRELETWFINGQTNGDKYPRMHDLTDAIAIVGIRSLPKMIQILADCLNLFYGNSNIALSEDHINITSSTVQASNFQAMNGASGNIVDSQGKMLAKVEYGIITEIY